MSTPIYDALVAELGDPVVIGYGFLRLLGTQPESKKRRGRHKRSEHMDDVT